jgi:hypothetical protein
MRSHLSTPAVIAVFLVTLSCKEDEKTTRVWGTIRANAAPEDTVLHGETLGETGTDLIGYCRLTDNRFSFAFATDSKIHLSSGDFYYEILGVEGPPSEGANDENGVLRENEDRTFKSVYIWLDSGEWRFDQGAMIEDECRVSLFAKSASGDLTSLDFGKETFQYALGIDCFNGLNPVENTTANDSLTGIRATLWFNHCE